MLRWRLLPLLTLSTIAQAGDGQILRYEKPIPGEYLVRIVRTVPPATVHSLAAQFAAENQGRVKEVMTAHVNLLVVNVSDAAAQRIARHPLVELVEENAEVQLEAAVAWNRDRVNQRVGTDGAISWLTTETLSTPVYAYVVDTGVLATHQSFWRTPTDPTSRVLPGKNFVNNLPDSLATNPCPGATCLSSRPCPSGDPFCLGGGHGTAVASVIAGSAYGLVGAKVIPLRVAPCSGSPSLTNIIDALNWIISDRATRGGRAVVNMSLTVKITATTLAQVSSMEGLLNNLIAMGVPVVAAAGNYNDSVANYSPARAPAVITVGGTSKNDGRWECNSSNPFEQCATANSGSNYGPGVDIFAPAQDIPSATIKEREAYPIASPVCLPEVVGGQLMGGCCLDSTTAERQGNRSGTSFSAPQVSAAVLQLLAIYPALTPAQVLDWLLNDPIYGATKGVMPDTTTPDSDFLLGSPNTFMYFAPHRIRPSFEELP